MKEHLDGTRHALDQWTQRRAGDFETVTVAPQNIGAVVQRTDALLRALSFMESRGWNARGAQVLDVGSGQGNGLYPFLKTGFTVSQLHGIDASAERVAEGQRFVPGIDVIQGDAANMPYPDASFDLVCEQFCFCHIPTPSIKPKIASEMRRVLKPGGFVMLMDWRTTSERHSIYGPALRDIREWFGQPLARFPAMLWPPIGRPVSKRLPSLYPLLTKIPGFTGAWVTVLRR